MLAAMEALTARARGGGVRCVYGKSGTGKTSAMSALAFRAGEAKQYHTVVFRACGTSVASSSAMGLMASVCEQLEECYGLNKSQPKVPPSGCAHALLLEGVRGLHACLWPRIDASLAGMGAETDAETSMTDAGAARRLRWRCRQRTS